MTDESTVCEHCFGTGQKVAMRPVRLGAKLPPFDACTYCTTSKPPPKPARFISKITEARRRRKGVWT
jgi:hypothetical protein